MTDTHTIDITPEQVAVITTDPTSLTGLPRHKDWRPSAPLLLLAKPYKCGGDALGYRLPDRHRAEDAATGEVRPAQIHPRDPEGVVPIRVVLKFQRFEVSQNVREGAVQVRLDEEHRALRHLAIELPEERRGDVPRSLQPDGQLQCADEALEVSSPMVFCIAAHHALGLRKTVRPSDNDGTIAQVLRGVVGRHPSACVGCGCRSDEPDPGTGEDDPIPPSCRPWLVTQREADDLSRFVMFPGRMLILDDMGTSLQSYIERTTESPISNLSRAVTLFGKLKALHGLALTLAAIHRANYLHLDLNLDNLCIDDGTPGHLRLGPIDFGHAEPLDATRDSYRDRIPIRRVDFASAEMQLRSFPLRVRPAAVKGDERDTEVWEVMGLTGWPRESWPAKGDVVELVGLGRSPPLLRVEDARPGDQLQLLRIVAKRIGGSKEPIVTPQSFLDAIVHRAPSPASDLFSFGLIALCWLSDVQRPMDFRNELAVLERSIGRGAVIDDTNWRTVHRRIFSHYSVLLNEVFPWWDKVLGAAGETQARVHLLRHAFLEGVRIAVKCVVRRKGWTYHARDTIDICDFDAVAADLHRLLIALTAGTVSPPPPLPITIDTFGRRAARALPDSLAEPERLYIQSVVDKLAGRMEKARRASAALAKTMRQASRAATDLKRLDDWWRRAETYEASWRALPWERRYVTARFSVWSSRTGMFHLAEGCGEFARRALAFTRAFLTSSWRGPVGEHARRVAARAQLGTAAFIKRAKAQSIAARLHRVAQLVSFGIRRLYQHAEHARATSVAHDLALRARANAIRFLEPPWSRCPPDPAALALAVRLRRLVPSALTPLNRCLQDAASRLDALATSLPELDHCLRNPRYFAHERQRVATIAADELALASALAPALDHFAAESTREYVDLRRHLEALRDASATLLGHLRDRARAWDVRRLAFEANTSESLRAVLDEQLSLAELMLIAQHARHDRLRERLAVLEATVQEFEQGIAAHLHTNGSLSTDLAPLERKLDAARAELARMVSITR